MKEYKEEDYLMISGIQHYVFCKRQWALIHLEHQWEDNLRTVEGNIMHDRAHDGPTLETRGDKIISREMRVFSKHLGITGVCDVVEFVRDDLGDNSIMLFGKEGKFGVIPVEYKKGESKSGNEDRMQLIAQVLCLEEMLSTQIDYGYLYYGTTKRREKVAITTEERNEIHRIVEDMHRMFENKHTPKVKWSKACNACSLNNLCVPKLLKNRNVSKYIWDKVSEE
ncbi:CRISPR-associated exonuclease Cas4 [Aequitasia blattaphilus]|uniref:CRISPR-associated exonuclease Cas4 n=1 Tax=Aequitasia blattaphilus TaxID=2949332 RepID=A0ABT1E868_9FIRM|nr:CRISPR-associated protein Cas4 [Aequitasia blattaphilus]MCP1102027.1 CRISPR-associated protein Cas4 [Aequitasia blattaphilus]MCR8614667.1 CRISPR-associated protein Cas4 [Aequitasia blattaphilus]